MNKSYHLPKRHFKPAGTLPLEVGTIHFVGIGGIGMSGIAEILHNLGYSVSGSDMSDNANVKRLRELGITIHIGHAEANVEEASVVVKSTAVKPDNPEVVAAIENHIPVLKRSEMLAELTRLKPTIAVAGTHGKTTTTSMIAHMMEEAGFEPTVINGGILNARGTNAYLGKGNWLITEADESDGTFIRIPSTVGVITNMDPEHLDYWKSFDQLKEAFQTFLQNQPFYGFAVLCYDHPDVKKLAEEMTGKRIIGYGITDEDADIKAEQIRASEDGGSQFNIRLNERVTGNGEIVVKNVSLPIPGEHNVLNSIAAFGIGLELGIEPEKLADIMANFAGVRRRFTKTGEVDGVIIIDDYAHHPVEIASTLSAARRVADKRGGRVIAVVQPHRYSRLENLFDEFCQCFGDADVVIVSEVFAAGEEPIKGADQHHLVQSIQHVEEVIALQGELQLADTVRNVAASGDIVVCMGAGSITNWANALPKQLAAEPLKTAVG